MTGSSAAELMELDWVKLGCVWRIRKCSASVAMRRGLPSRSARLEATRTYRAHGNTRDDARTHGYLATHGFSDARVHTCRERAGKKALERERETETKVEGKRTRGALQNRRRSNKLI
eukprot:242232-Pleurochrysis_carterae.AAC.2